MVASLSLTSGPIISKARLTEAIKDGFSSGALSQLDRWVECTNLTMQFVRHDSVILNALDTRWTGAPRHTCDDLHALVAGPPYPFQLNPPTPYLSYPSGARHLLALPLSVSSLWTTMGLYRVLSYASVLALFLAAWRNSPRHAFLVVAPIAMLLMFAFEQHRYANNTLWAPGFFVGFLALSVFVAMRNWFQDRARRLGFFCFLGVIAGYFDTLHGVLPVHLSLTIVLDHFFYAERDEEIRGFAAVRNALTIALCFIAAFALLTIVRLGLLQLVASDPVWPNFFHRLSHRMSSVTGDNPAIGILDLIFKLWSERKEMTGSRTSSTILLCAGASAWLLTLVSIVVFRAKQKAAGLTAGLGPAVIGIFVLAMGSGVILVWYLFFKNHTLIHAWVMVRMLALPIAYGFAAWMLVIVHWRETRVPRTQPA